MKEKTGMVLQFCVRTMKGLITMDDVMTAIRKGSPEAMMALMNGYRKQTDFLCRTLFPDTADRNQIAAYKATLDDIISGKTETEAAFAAAVTRRVIAGCRTGTLKKDNRAFRVPADFSGLCLPEKPTGLKAGQGVCRILAAMPPLQRFVYVLDGACGYPAEEIASVLDVGQRAVEKILEVEEDNIARAAVTAGEYRMSRTEFQNAIAEAVQATVPAGPCEDEVGAYARKVCEPIRQAVRKKQKKTIVVAAVAVALLAVISLALVMLFSGNGAGGNADGPDYIAEIVIQDYGTITLELDHSAAPITVENFVSLARSGFYDGLKFHRIIEGFMMQGGASDGTKPEPEQINGEFKENGWDNPISHKRGVISMARATDPDSASSQFFIVHQDSTYLDGKYAAFGHVTDGIEVVDAVCEASNPTDNNGTIPEDEQPVIVSVTVREKT